MNPLIRLKHFRDQRLEKLHLRLANREAQFQLALLGMLSGIMAGAAMVCFRLAIEIPQAFFLGAENPENYEALNPFLRLLLPTAGGLLVGWFFHRLASPDRAVGVVHVMERLAFGEGILPIKNAGVQFLSATLCILFGHSVGREGPSIHIGAACASWMGQRIRLPHNSIRVLVGCGTAGAIAAAFNTPLAGVIFAMEVVLVEYTLASFTPIILASVSATAVSHWAFGSGSIFLMPALRLGALGDLFHVTLMGVGIGLLSTLFVRSLVFFSQRLTHRSLWFRMTLAGLLTGILAMFVPEIMGIGYDTVEKALQGTLGLELMLVILACKLLATALGLGLGLPGGVIGPTLVMGALAGGATGAAVTLLLPEHASFPALYTLLGMGAMMGATLNAPLAALTAMLELTANPHIILPGMLAIVAAQLTSHHGLGTPSVFLGLMQARGLRYGSDPISQFLRHLGVTHAMDRQVIRLSPPVERNQLEQTLAAQPSWVLVEAHGLLSRDELRRLLASEKLEEGQVDLDSLSVPWIETRSISSQATLDAALRKMNRDGVNALYVLSHGDERVLGVVTRAAVERSYRLPLN